jgi:hypothetical protein|tara:strand:- start:6517 stop:6948 length:432 start_codon:yes stop_codon:yes gene_type:complete
MPSNITEDKGFASKIPESAFKNLETYQGESDWTPAHFVDGKLYANFVWEMIYDPNVKMLDRFGPYSTEGVIDEFIEPEEKVFMFLDSMLQSGEDAELFWQTSSTLVLDEVAKHCQIWEENPQRDVKELFLEMRDSMEEYMEGC